MNDVALGPRFDDLAAVFYGDSDMARRMRAHDWSTSPLGHPLRWPQSLRSVVNLMIESRHPMFVAWGPKLAFLYNDAYAPIFGAKHPKALGLPFRQVWSEIWDDIEPLIARALAGEPTWSENLHLVMERNGYPEDTWYTFSYSPARDETGAVAGLFCACTETTRAVRADERALGQKRILELVAAGAPVDKTLDELMLFIEAQEPGVRAGLMLVSENGKRLLRGSGPSLPESYHSALDGVAVAAPYLGSCSEAVGRDCPVLASDVASDQSYSEKWRNVLLSCGLASCRSTPVRRSDGRALGCLALYYDRPCDPTPSQPELIDIATHLAAIAIERDRTGKTALGELENARLLQAVSARFIQETDIHALYEMILDAATAIMRSDFGSMQLLSSGRGVGPELHLLSFRGFTPQAARYWEWVEPDSRTTCGMALQTGKRVIAADVETCDFMVGAPDLAIYRETGIRACQTTPLLSRTGETLGMISTHWRAPHEPRERELRLLDVLARQAADLIERSQAEAARCATADMLSAVVSASPIPVVVADLDATIRVWNKAAEDVFGWSADEIIGQVLPIVPDEKMEECRSVRDALARGETIAGLETYRRRKDGSRIEVQVFGARLTDAGGAVTGAVLLFGDITERNAAAREVAVAQDRLATALDAGKLGAFDVTAATGAMTCTARCKANFGREPNAPFTYADLLEAIVPGDRERVRQALGKSIELGADYREEYRCQWPDGATHWIEAQGRPELKNDGLHLIGVTRDVTEAKLAEERQRLLTNELNHRVKNTLAVIQAIASQTARFSPEPGPFQEAFTNRLMALARVHDVLTKASWKQASLDTVVKASIAPFAGEDGRAVRVAGPPAPLDVSSAMALSLALNELATNAGKYGALKKPGGFVSIDWTISGEPPRIRLSWVEHDGPPVADPVFAGFGSLLIERLAVQLGGSVMIDYRPEGVRCEIAMPLGDGERHHGKRVPTRGSETPADTSSRHNVV